MLALRGLSKRFGAVRALEGMDFTLRGGEVHAVMGENGAGKSTLIKCLTGVHRPDAGEMMLSGRRLAPGSPRQAEGEGIATVYQEVNLIPHMSVAENICLGREPVRRGWARCIRWGEVRRRARAAIDRLGLTLDVSRELGVCSIAVQQLVAIARALDLDARVLILDEPTSSLDRGEVARLFDILHRLRDGGMGIVFITHFLDQVYAVADRITVLRDGRLVGVHRAADLSRERLVGEMVGRAFEAWSAAGGSGEAREATAAPRGETVVRARGLGRRGALEHADVDVAAGEAVGLAGLLGSGRTETARLLFGADRADRGELWFGGVAVRFRSPRQAIGQGVGLSPESRQAEGVIPSLSVQENIELALQAKHGLRRKLGAADRRELALGFIRSLGIKAPGPDAPVGQLSGGNQQKVLLARWLATEPRLLILDEPTRGIDVAAKAEIMRAIDDLRARGMAILFISSELDEVVRLCGRVVVLRDRRSIAELSGETLTERAVLASIAGRHG